MRAALRPPGAPVGGTPRASGVGWVSEGSLRDVCWETITVPWVWPSEWGQRLSCSRYTRAVGALPLPPRLALSLGGPPGHAAISAVGFTRPSAPVPSALTFTMPSTARAQATGRQPHSPGPVHADKGWGDGTPGVCPAWLLGTEVT